LSEHQLAAGIFFKYDSKICKEQDRDTAVKAASDCGTVSRYEEKSDFSTVIAYAISF
jgi:hypothetical protein